MWPLDFDDDAATVAQLRSVYLTEAGAAERLRLERSEQLADARVQLFFDARLDFLERHRRHVVLQMRQLLDIGLGEQIRARRENLTELDVSGPQLHQPFAECLCL